MKTKKLYEQDAYLKAFTAQVLECREEERGWMVLLDQTVFYPEGGGQPWDTGVLGEAKVLEVHQKEGLIYHLCDHKLEAGAYVEGRIDWERRFDFMQQHTGEHIVSGVIHSQFGYNNVGFHLTQRQMTIDLSGELSMEQLRQVEQMANQKVWDNLPVEIFWPSPQELETLPYRSKKELFEAVRLVRIPETDLCACCGTHVACTGEIGLIKLISCQRFREGVRIELACGKRALDYCNLVLEQNHGVSVLLSAKVGETSQAVERLYQEKERLSARVLALEEEIFQGKARALAGADQITLFEEGLEPDSLRRLTIALLEVCPGRCAVFSGSDQEGYKYAIGHKDGDLRQLIKALNQTLNGRGGGKPFFAQGQVQASRGEIEAFLAQWE